MFYTTHKWNTSDRTWLQYPKEIMGPLTTLEDSKPDTCIILVNTYC